MRYTIKGKWFGHDEEWKETADNEDELLWVIDNKVHNNSAIDSYEVYDESGNEIDDEEISDMREETQI